MTVDTISKVVTIALRSGFWQETRKILRVIALLYYQEISPQFIAKTHSSPLG